MGTLTCASHEGKLSVFVVVDFFPQTEQRVRVVSTVLLTARISLFLVKRCFKPLVCEWFSPHFISLFLVFSCMPSASSPKSSKDIAKKVVFVALENVLIPGEAVQDISPTKVESFLVELTAFAKSANARVFLLSVHDKTWAENLVREKKWENFFPPSSIFGITSAYLDSMQPVDRVRFESKRKDNPESVDEYYRQVAMQEIISTNHFSPEECVLIGQDYWFDGFYTRRYAMVDILFIENTLTSRGKPVAEKISGLWYAPLAFDSIQPFFRQGVASPNYKPLDTWASVTLTEELLGAQKFNMIKRLVLEKKKDGTIHPVSSSFHTAPSPDNGPPPVV